VELPDDALVIRFPPVAPEGVLRGAQKEARRTGGLHRLSVFAGVARDEETEAQLVDRLLAASEVAGINPATNRKYFVCVRADELLSRGFTFWKDDEDEEELPEHYNVDLGPEPGLADAERFGEAFGPSMRR